MAKTTERAELGAQEILVKDVGGVRELPMRLVPGINVLKGPNGAGKTSAARAIAKAYGADGKVEKRDGTPRGRVEIPGAVVTFGQVARRTGEPEVALADVGPVSRFIDPGIDDPTRADLARQRAVLELFPAGIDAAKLEALAGHDEVARAVGEELAEGGITDLLAAAERCRLVGHKLAREAEDAVRHAEGLAGGAQQRLDAALARLGGDDAVVAETAAEAGRAVDVAVRHHALAEQAHRKRLELEQRQAEIREGLGDAPDPGRFDRDLRIREDRLKSLQERKSDLLRRLAEVDREMAVLESDLATLERQQREEGSRAERHREALRVLALPVEGPTADEVDAQALEVERAREQERVAVLSDAVRSAEADLEAARERVAEAKRRATGLREAATSIGWRISEQLAEAGVQGLAFTQDGRLAVVEADGTLHDLATRRSEGQRIIAALRLFAPKLAGRVVPLAGHLYQALDDGHRAELAQIADELGIYLLTEEPATGSLRVEKYGEGAVAA